MRSWGDRDGRTRYPERRYDAALSTTALHWLPAADLRRCYRDLHRVLRKGGVFLDGDHLPWGTEHRRLSRLAESVRQVRFEGASINSEWAAWRKWWREAERVPELKPLFRERAARAVAAPSAWGCFFRGTFPSPATGGISRRRGRLAGHREPSIAGAPVNLRCTAGAGIAPPISAAFGRPAGVLLSVRFGDERRGLRTWTYPRAPCGSRCASN